MEPEKKDWKRAQVILDPKTHRKATIEKAKTGKRTLSDLLSEIIINHYKNKR